MDTKAAVYVKDFLKKGKKQYLRDFNRHIQNLNVGYSLREKNSKRCKRLGAR